MRYVDRVLGSNEEVVHETHLHWVTYVCPAFFLVLAILAVPFLAAPDPQLRLGAMILGGIFALLAIVGLISAAIERWTTEIAVTTRRIIFKCGLIARDTIELNFNRVEGLDVRQTICGRLFNYGTVAVRGTGLGNQPMKYVAGPVELRNAAFGADEAHGSRQYYRR